MITQRQSRLIVGILATFMLLLAACSTSSESPATAVSSDTAAHPLPTVVEAEQVIVDEDSAETVTTSNSTQVTQDAAETETESEQAAPIENAAVEADEADDEAARPDGWRDESHSNDVDPNYDIVFPQDRVNTLTISIDSADWQAMLDNMTELYGAPTGQARGGGGGNRPQGGAGGNIVDRLPEGCELPEGFVPGPEAVWPEGCQPEPRAGGQAGGRGAGGAGGGGVNLGIEENPDYVAATIEFDGDVWTNVGVRFKGNSTLRNAWNSGSIELPFKLDFDEYEDEYPEIDNQRFYGFKQLSLSNPASDASYVRAAMAYNVMQDAGLVAPETAWYDLYVDYGEGPVSFGLYTFVEVIDDSVIETAFGDDDGNIYEGDGTGSSLAVGTFDQIPDSFQKENNDEADYGDMEALYNALHAETRLTDSDQWREDLEAVFDVDTFLKWLALNSTIVNWDTYGQAAHNFYLYHNPENDLLTWIGWDYNESLQAGRRGTATLGMTEVTDAWPLIRYMLDQPTYYEQYRAYVAEVAAGAFAADKVEAQLSAWETMLTPFVADAAAFSSQIDTITTFVNARQAAVEAFAASGQ